MVRTKSFVARLVTACACACSLASPAPALAAPQGATALEAQDTTLYVSDDFSAYLTNGSSYAYTGRAVEPSVTVYYYVDEINQADDSVWDSILGFDFDYETYYVDPDAYWYTYDPEKDRTTGRRTRKVFVRGQPVRVLVGPLLHQLPDAHAGKGLDLVYGKFSIFDHGYAMGR